MTRPSPGATTAIANILTWQRAHQGQVPYSETASTRLASDLASLLTPTDCSGMVHRMFMHFAGIDVGTYTGNECDYGQLITTDKAAAAAGKGMLPGDCILFDWPSGRSTWDHIAIYAGDGRIWNHGGPGNGPLDWSLASNVNAAVKVMVRRFLTDTNPLEETMAAWPDAPKTYAQYLDDVEARVAKQNAISRTLIRQMLGFAIVVIRKGWPRGWFSPANIPDAFPAPPPAARPSPTAKSNG